MTAAGRDTAGLPDAGWEPPRGQAPPAGGIVYPLPCPACGAAAVMADGRCARCFAVFPNRCEACNSPTPRAARFCQNCGAALAPEAEDNASRHAQPAREKRQLTVMFCDLVGSSALAAGLDPEDFSDIIGTFHRCVTETVSAHGGFLARYMGDGALFYFGYPYAEEDDAERAGRAGLAVIDAVSELRMGNGSRLHVRVGLATGLVVVGDVVGMGGPLSLDVAGETPNLAARLQGLAEPDTVLASGSLHTLVEPLFEWRGLGELEVRGWDKPVPVWQVLRPARVLNRFEARTGGEAAPLLGRTHATLRLSALWAEAAAGRGCAVLLTGEAGIGKSRLVAYLLEAEREQTTRARWFCARQSRGTPLQPVIEQVAHLADLRREDDDQAKLRKLDRAVLGADPLGLALIAELLGIRTGAKETSLALSPLRRQERLLQALFGVLARAAERRPVLAVCEDAHWADPSTRELLAYAVPRVGDHRILLLVTARSEFEPSWPHTTKVERFALGPLGDEEAVRLVNWTAGGHVLPRATVEDIVARADGVPLFIEELTKTVLATREPSAVPGMPLFRESRATVPNSLHASLTARLDRLGADREVAEVAAVVGRNFSLDVLGRATERDDTRLRSALWRLEESGIVERRGARGYMFRHALLHDAAYGLITRERRRWLHGRIATAIDTHMPELAEAEPQVLAQHWTEAQQHERAAAAWLRAGRQALRRSAPREAMAALKSGIEALERLELTPALMRMEIELRVLQATAASVTLGPGLPVVGEALRRVLALSPQMPDTPYMLYALYTLWLHTFTRGEIDSAVQQAEDLSRFAKRHPGPGRQLCAVRAAGLTQFVRGEFNTAATLLAVGIGLYDPEIRPVFARLTVHDPVTDMRCYRSWSLLFRGRLAEARAESAQALAGARESGHFFTQAHALLTMAFINLHCGHTARGIATLREMFALADEHGFPYFESAGRVFEGYYLGRDGDAEAGLALVRAGAKWNVETESFLYVPGFIACEAELLARLGRHEEARGRMAAALRQMELTKACWDEAEIRTIDGIVRRLHCDSDGAETALRKAIEVACSQGAALRRLRAATALADLLATQGRQDAAREALAPALAPFEAEADAPAVLQAREFLAHL